MTIFKIDARRLTDDAALHAVIQETLALPADYGKNWDALADALTHLDAAAAGPVTVVLNYADAFARQRPALWQQLHDVAAFANWRRAEKNQPPVICLAYHRH